VVLNSIPEELFKEDSCSESDAEGEEGCAEEEEEEEEEDEQRDCDAMRFVPYLPTHGTPPFSSDTMS
jgi:hypothetical protein